MPRVLKDLQISEVSSVDRGAGRGVKVLIMKRGATAAKPNGESEMTDAEIAALVSKSLSDALPKAVADAVTPVQAALAKAEREVKVLKMSPKQKSFYDGLKDEESKKSFADMSDEDKEKEVDKVAKAAAGDPALAEMAKRFDDVNAQNVELKKRLDQVDLEKAQETFKKKAADLGATEAGDGELMRKAYAGDATAQTAWDARLIAVNKALQAQVQAGDLFKAFGTTVAANGNAYQSLVAKAEELRKTDTKLSPQQAFSKVYTDPANAQLVETYKSEEARGRAQVVA